MPKPSLPLPVHYVGTFTLLLIYRVETNISPLSPSPTVILPFPISYLATSSVGWFVMIYLSFDVNMIQDDVDLGFCQLISLIA